MSDNEIWRNGLVIKDLEDMNDAERLLRFENIYHFARRIHDDKINEIRTPDADHYLAEVALLQCLSDGSDKKFWDYWSSLPETDD